MAVACVTCLLCLLTDGNTVSCCENKGVKDQNGNDLRLCSAIDQERVQADEDNKKGTTVYICRLLDKRPPANHEGHEANYSWKNNHFYSCFDKNNNVICAHNSLSMPKKYGKCSNNYLISCPNVSTVVEGHKIIEKDGRETGNIDICNTASKGLSEYTNKCIDEPFCSLF